MKRDNFIPLAFGFFVVGYIVSILVWLGLLYRAPGAQFAYSFLFPLERAMSSYTSSMGAMARSCVMAGTWVVAFTIFALFRRALARYGVIAAYVVLGAAVHYVKCMTR